MLSATPSGRLFTAPARTSVTLPVREDNQVTRDRRIGASLSSQPRSRALRVGVPRRARHCETGGEEEVEAQPEDVVGGVDAQQLLDDAKRGVAGDVEREQPGARMSRRCPSHTRPAASDRFQMVS